MEVFYQIGYCVYIDNIQIGFVKTNCNRVMSLDCCQFLILNSFSAQIDRI